MYEFLLNNVVLCFLGVIIFMLEKKSVELVWDLIWVFMIMLEMGILFFVLYVIYDKLFKVKVS